MNLRNIAKKREEVPNAGTNKEACAKLADNLCGLLASTYALYQKTLFFHWNVTGPHFVGLHSLFEQQYQELHQAGDDIAERIRALGRLAPGSMAEFSALSRVKDSGKLPAKAEAMVADLLKSHELCSLEAREVLNFAKEAEDEVTADQMVTRMRVHDKAAWMLRSIIE